jgi:hypothetical protein
MDIKLEDCIEQTSAFYLTLENPKFVGQTRCDENNEYWMVFEADGKHYKFKHKL